MHLTDCTRASNTVNAAACDCRQRDDNGLAWSPQYRCNNAARLASGAKGNNPEWVEWVDWVDWVDCPPSLD